MIVVTAWLVNCAVVALVLTAGAAVWEAGARWSGRPARWGWLAALAGSVAVPWVLRLMPERVWPEAVPAAMPMLTLDPLVLTAAESTRWSASDVGLGVWLALSLLMAAYVVRVLVQLGRARREWRETELDGGRVYVTRNTGPAALGVRRGMIVVPTWALGLDAELRSLLLQHEREHVRAGDPRLLMAGLVLLVAMPWNAVLWFQLLRLRNAIELDCDSRVLAHGADPQRYGSLLLEVGRRRGTSALVMATFAEPRLFLEQRIRRIAQWPLERRPARAAALSVIALLLFATALSARDPLRTGAPGRDAAGPQSEQGPDLERLMMAVDTPPLTPYFTPMTVTPNLQNRDDVQIALLANYPPLLRDAGIGGSPVLWFYIDVEGVVRRVLIKEGSGYPALDEAALDVGRMMRFTPARNGDERVPVWVEIPVVFNAPGSATGGVVYRSEETRADLERTLTERARGAVGRGGAQAEFSAREQRVRELAETAGAGRVALRRELADTARAGRVVRLRELPEPPLPPPPGHPPAPVTQLPLTDGPTFTPMTVAPELRNRDDVHRALTANYPPMLRDAGIGGAPVVWLLIDDAGFVRDVRMRKGSGHPALDEAALLVGRTMYFEPAMNRDEKVSVWVEVPILFSAR